MTEEFKNRLKEYFSFENMDDMEDLDKYKYINLILHTKDVTDSEINVNDYYSRYDLSWLKLEYNKEKKYVMFDGMIFNESESKTIRGSIKRRGNNYSIVTFVSRLSDSVLEEDKDYITYDIFSFDGDRVIRRSRYENTLYKEEEIDYTDPVEIEDYLNNKVKALELK